MMERARLSNGYLSGIALLLLALPLSACVSVLPEAKTAPTIYRLNIPHGNDTISLDNTKVINIEFPQAPRALSGTDIVLSPDGRRLTAAAGASWAEPVPSQLRHILIDILAQNGRITGVIPKGGTRAPYRLNTEIRRFEAVFDNGEDAPPNALLLLNVTLTDTNTRKLVGTHTVKKTVRARAKSVSSIVDAQDKATNAAMHDIAKWLDGMVGKRPR